MGMRIPCLPELCLVRRGAHSAFVYVGVFGVDVDMDVDMDVDIDIYTALYQV